jgi:hypothetical protein
VFDIRFLNAPPEQREEGGLGLWGEVTLGEYRERFLAPLGLWPRERYEQQWREAAERLLQGAERTAFFTVALQFWWTMARSGQDVLVQEELITGERVEQLGSALDPDIVPYELLRPISLETEDGERISTWRIAFTDVASFAARHREGGAA